MKRRDFIAALAARPRGTILGEGHQAEREAREMNITGRDLRTPDALRVIAEVVAA